MHRGRAPRVGIQPRSANRGRVIRLRPTRLLAICGLALVAFLYWKPTHTYLHAKQQLQTRNAEVQALRAEKVRLQRAHRAGRHRRAARPRGASARPRQAGRAAVHRARHPRVAQAPLVAAIASLQRMTDEELVARQIGRTPRAFRARRRALPVRTPRRDRAGAVRRGRDSRSRRSTTSRARISSQRSRGSRPRAASSAGRARQSRTTSSRTASPTRRPSSAALRPELDAGIGGSTRTGSLKCLHAHAAFALARPGYELGDRILAELPAIWPDSCCTA